MQELSHAEFLGILKKRAIEISVMEGRLKVSAPTGAIDAELRAELARRKPELVAAIQCAGTTASPPLTATERNGKIPQTAAQRGMWLIDFFDPGNSSNNIADAFSIEAPVDLKALQNAVDKLLARHEVLRTYFYEEEGEFFQAIAADARAVVGVTDLSAMGEKDRMQTLQKSLREKTAEPFDLGRAPMVRFHLFRLTPDRQGLSYTIHHIVSDLQSLSIVRQELMLLYEAALRNGDANLPALPVQFADYAIWAEKRLASGALEGQIQYWKTKLAGTPPYLQLPSSKPYPERRKPTGGVAHVSISAVARDGLGEIAREERATMFMTLFACFAALLYRQSGQEDFCLGTPFTFRSQVATERLIGVFVNMLVLRCQFGDAPSFREFLGRVRTTALEAYENSEIPFQQLVRTLKPDLRSRRAPLFQIVFGLDSEGPAAQSEMFPAEGDTITAKFDLALHLLEGGDGVTGWFEYCTDLFDAASIGQMGRQFVHLLGEIARNPDRPLRELAIE